MMRILSDYAISVGLHINFHKSTLVPINLNQIDTHTLAQIFQCAVGSMPFTYLGLPMGTTRPSVVDLMPLVSSVQRRMPAAASLLDYGSKLTLVNLVITSLAVYAMSSVKIHPRIVDHLDKLRRSCLWKKKTKDGLKGNSLASWDLVCRPKTRGGMGIINLKLQNQELLLKQLHKFYNNDDIPWVQLIWSAYYTDKVPHSTEPCGSFWWRDVLQLSDVYRGVTRVNVGDGKTTLFWKDLWQDQVISESHPRAFSFCRQEDISVNKLLSAESLGQIFHLPLLIEAREEIKDLQDTTRGVDPSSGTNDTWLCAWGGKEFRANKFYSYCFINVQVDEAFGWIWKTKCTMQWKVFLWLLLADRLNTRNMLRRRHYRVNNDDYNCLLCHNPPEESLLHLFFRCPFSVSC